MRLSVVLAALLLLTGCEPRLAIDADLIATYRVSLMFSSAMPYHHRRWPLNRFPKT